MLENKLQREPYRKPNIVFENKHIPIDNLQIGDKGNLDVTFKVKGSRLEMIDGADRMFKTIEIIKAKKIGK